VVAPSLSALRSLAPNAPVLVLLVAMIVAAAATVVIVEATAVTAALVAIVTDFQLTVSIRNHSGAAFLSGS
jgi:hypothetical protein